MTVLGALLTCGAASAYEPLPDPQPTMRCDRGGGFCAGTDRRDAVLGSNVADEIRAKAGADWADARRGNDALHGGTDEVHLRGGTGQDDLHGGPHRDWLDGDDNADALHGGRGRDSLDGDAGEDTVWGGKEGDSMDGDDGDDALYGGSGDDYIHSTGSGVDRLYGGDGDDELFVWQDGAEDYLYCGEGHDVYYLLDADSSHHVFASCEEKRVMQGLIPPYEFYYD
jgi:Ca2+-binding RTX toxin-like protein